MSKKIILSLNLLITIVMTSFFFIPKQQTYVMVGMTSSNQAATELARNYEITLLEYNEYGITQFEVYDQKIKDLLIDNGFFLNTELQIGERPSQTTVDPYLKDQYAISMLEIDQAWALSEGSSEISIAIIDTGINTDHTEFAGRILPNSYNSRTDTVGLAAVEDTNGYSTAVAGVIGAIKDNSTGIAGVLQNNSLLIIKANLDDDPLTEEDESDTFNDAFVTSTDNSLGEVVIVVSGSVGSEVGTYKITYAATDLSGNTSHIDRYVHVINP